MLTSAGYFKVFEELPINHFDSKIMDFSNLPKITLNLIKVFFQFLESTPILKEETVRDILESDF